MLTPYIDKGDSDQDLRRCFCNRCGSPLYSEADAMLDLAIIKAVTLDDTRSFKPAINIFFDLKWHG
jgi:hypothetical protein